VPLSEHEQRRVEQVERLVAEEPKFASAVGASGPRFHGRRRVVVAAVLVVVGLGLVVYGAVSKGTVVGVAGFVVMLGAAGFALTSLRRAHGNELRSVGGSARRSTRRRSSLIDRLEERWRQRPEDSR